MTIAQIQLLLKRKLRHVIGYKIGYSQDNKQPYFSIPELNIKGRRPGTDIQTRMQGLEFLLPEIKNNNLESMLDAGCAEGLIAQSFYDAGIKIIHGSDLQDVSIEIAKKIFSMKDGDIFFAQADFLNWETFEEKNRKVLLDGYDVVLFLSVYNHIVRIDEKSANEALVNLAKKAKKYFIVRSSAAIPEHLVTEQGFQLNHPTKQQKESNLSIFQRIT